MNREMQECLIVVAVNYYTSKVERICSNVLLNDLQDNHEHFGFVATYPATTWL